MRLRLICALTGSSLALFASVVFAQTPSFRPDQTFQGSSLEDWHTVGGAKWNAESGVISGDGNNNTPGWLFLNHPYQDAGVFVSFQCDGTCDTGILLRAEKSGDSTHGVFLSLKDADLGAYGVTVNRDGLIVDRSKLRMAGGLVRFAQPPPDPSAGPSAPMRLALPAPPPGVTLPIARPKQGLRNNDWNEVEIELDADLIRAFLNDGGGQVSNATEDMDAFGPFAFYVGPNSRVRFRNVAWKDLAFKTDAKEEVSPHFHMQRLNSFYYGWSAAAADFNRDGKLDLVTGPFIYYGPDFTEFREIYPAQAYNSSTQFSMNDWVEHAYDFTGDGWPDVLTTSHADGGRVGAVLYVNPQGASRRWKSYTVVTPVDSEETLLADVDGDGKPELVYIGGGYMCYAKPDPSDPTTPWIVHPISERGPWPAHGIGVGDINGDGKLDILGAEGWWEQPASGAPDSKWKYHPVAFGEWGRTSPGGSVIGVYDVNGDGLNDVVTVLQAHGWGIAWFEQKRSPDGQITFVKHMVMGHTPEESAGGVVFTEPHGTAIADVDGDGIPDFIIGKRLWSHNDDYYDPDPYGAPVLYWYRTVRDKSAPGGARLVPELINNRSGAGSDVLAVDLNGDGAIDIVTATRSGTYIFWGVPAQQNNHK